MSSKERSRSNRGRVVVVTGASAGVGRAAARAFAAQGAQLGLLAREPQRLQSAQREVEQAGGSALALPTDVSDPDQVEEAARAIEEAFGPIDVWVNNAMTAVFSPIAETTAEEFRRVTEVTYLGAVYGTQAALKRMLPRDQGTIVQVGSALAYRAIPLQASYCAAKHAMQGFTESLRCELLHERSNVRVIMVQLPALNTPQFDWVRTRLPRRPQPAPPIFEPELAAAAVLRAAEEDRRESWVGWPVVKAMLADKLVPGFADRYLARRGYEGQQTDEVMEGESEGNLFRPVPGDPGAHGRFSSRARRRSVQFGLSRSRVWLGAAAFGMLAAITALILFT
jgi:NAD(P)-dependent dehydrogenase (short-subunit alcohol dehydrogenase family)